MCGVYVVWYAQQAVLIWTANRAINAMGGNRESEKNDFFAIHAW